MLDIFVFCGEKSADNLGFHYIQKILKENPNCKICGVLGPKLSTLKIKKFMDIQEFNVMGFLAVLKKIGALILKFYAVKRKILKESPKTLLLIDSPDFSLRLARSLKRCGYRGHIIQYVCPSIWAWRPSRKKLIDAYIDELLCLLPFEPPLFNNSRVHVRLMPHPLAHEIACYNYPFSLKEIQGKKPLLLLPGSRIQEIKDNLKLQLKVAKHFKEYCPCILVSSNKALVTIIKILAKEKELPYLIEPSAKYDIMKSSYIALAKCGSSNLELALHMTPTVIMYNTSKFDRFLANKIFKLKLQFFSLPNLIANKSIFPEHIKKQATEKDLVNSLKTLLTQNEHSLCKERCLELKKSLLKQ